MEEERSIRMDEINLRVILKDLILNSVFVLMAVLIVMMGIRTYKNIIYVPEYTSNATLAIIAKGNADGNAYTSLTTANSMAEVFAEVFQSSIIADKVEEVLGEMPEGTKISSALIPETNLLELKVKTRDPQSAFRVIQVILDNYQYVSDYLFSNAVLELIKDPMVPVAPSNSFNTSKLDKLGILGAVVLMCGLITVLSVLRGTVKTTKGAKRNLEGRCMAAIPYEEKNHTLKGKLLRYNKALLLNGQVVSFRYEESFHQLATVLDHDMSKNGQKLLLVTSVAENEGKSTVSINLATVLAQMNKKVLVIDLDTQKPALYKLLEHRVPAKEQLLEFLNGKTNFEDLLYYDKQMQIYTVLGDRYVNDIQPYLNSDVFRALLKRAKAEFDYVILDSSPVSSGSDVEYLENMVDASLLVVHQDVVHISDLNDTIEMLKEGQSEFLGYVLNAFDMTGSSHSYGYGKYGYYGYYGRYDRYGSEPEQAEKEKR